MDPLYSYYMACGFSRGILHAENDEGERRIIFSVWDASTRRWTCRSCRKQGAVNGQRKMWWQTIFGNERRQLRFGLCFRHPQQTYKFLVTAATDRYHNHQLCGCWLCAEWQKWKLIACFKAPKDGKTSTGATGTRKLPGTNENQNAQRLGLATSETGKTK